MALSTPLTADAPAGRAVTVHGQDTLPRLFRHVVRERGDRVAMREKDLGIWRAISWREYGERARHVGLGLVALGLRPRDVVSIIADNCPEWLYTDMGVMAAAAVPNGIYTTDSAKQIEYIINDSGSRFLFVENEEQLDKALAIRARCPDLVKIFVFDMEGLHGFRDDQVMTFEALLGLGAAYEREHPEAYDRLVDIPRAEDLAILVYTSGTTGPPKGAMLSHRNILFQVAYADFITPLREGDDQLSFLPLCHVAERTLTVFNPLHTGATVNFAESIETVPENIREVAPAAFFAVPRIWEKFYSGVALRMRDATWLGRVAYGTAIGIGLRLADHRIAGRRPSLLLRAAFRVADFLVLDNVKRSIGLHRARGTGSGAAPISPDLIRWYMALGLDMREVYGQTENTGLATGMPPDRIKLGTVGIARPETEVRLSPEGEILLKGPHVFMGYFGKPEKTAETIVDGWLHTGDVGTIDADGFVHVTDRMTDIIITAGGKNVTPSEIENQLKFSPYISDAVVIGDRRKFLSCLVMIDPETVAQFAQEKNVPFSSFASLCRAPEVQELIRGEIEQVNKHLARVEAIKEFRLIEQLLTPEDEELTPTMKLRRKFVNVKYRNLIDEMYERSER
jgi:long-chain acyl-CoA synthetase